MSSVQAATHSVREWSTPTRRLVEGTPPSPGIRADTLKSEQRQHDVRTVTPSYKVSGPVSPVPNGDSGYRSSTFSTLSSGAGDYKVQESREQYRMHIIDPKVRSTANMPVHSQTLPSQYRRTKTADFPSQHTKRSFLNLAPMEQRRLRSVETRPITTSTYLTESLERHRDMEASRLRDYLKAKEREANQPWNKPNWPGCKAGDPNEGLRELEEIRKSIDSLQKRFYRTQSMGELMVTPAEYERQEPQAELNYDPGWIIRARKQRYLDLVEASLGEGMKRSKSFDHLRSRRNSSRAASTLPYAVDDQWIYSNGDAGSKSPSFPPPPDDHFKQPLYPPGSRDNIVSEKTPPLRPKFEKSVYENNPLPAGGIISQKSPLTISTSGPKSILKSPIQTLAGEESREQKYSTRWAQLADFHATSDSQLNSMPVPSGGDDSERERQLKEEERRRLAEMQENIRRLKDNRPTTPKPPAASFNGPFFTLEDVSQQGGRPQQQQQQQQQQQHQHQQQQNTTMSNTFSAASSYFKQESSSYGQKGGRPGPTVAPKPQSRQNTEERMQLSPTHMSRSNAELNRDYDERKVVVWPPGDQQPPRPSSAMSRSLHDADRVDEYKRQKRLEEDSIRRREEELMRYHEKHVHAWQSRHATPVYMEKEKQVQAGGMVNNYHHPDSPPSQRRDRPREQEQQQQPPAQYQQPTNMHVFETRPISALSDAVGEHKLALSPGGTTWRRTYVVDSAKDRQMDKNEIIKSEELLAREQYYVDMLARRDAFVERPDRPIEVHRVGRRWQPPPERPYIWPQSVRRPLSVQTPAPGIEEDVDEYRWTPVIRDPNFKRERKNFTPEHSPPSTPRRGSGVGPLDDAARRQQRYTIAPSPDGRHRPQPAFHSPRQRPAGGFLPAAPMVRQVGQAATSSHTEQRRVHRQHYQDERTLQHDQVYQQQQPHERADYIPDWEKIYDLPPHTSTICGRDTPSNVNIKKRIALFQQAERRRVTRVQSADAPTRSTPPTTRGLRRSTYDRSAGGSLFGAPVMDHPSHQRPPSREQQRPSHQQQPRRDEDRFTQRGQQRFYPPPLPPGHRRPTSPPGQSTSTKRQSLNEGPKRNEELERLAALRDNLSQRAKDRATDYKGKESEIHKVGPAPVPDHVKWLVNFQDQIRDILESRVSNDTSSTSAINQQDRSGYVTDVSSATWQFSSQSFSPRSVVSINGGTKDDGLLKVRTDLLPSTNLDRTMSRSNAGVQTMAYESQQQQQQQPWQYMGNSPASTMTRECNENYTRKVERFNSLPVLDDDDRHSTLIHIKDDRSLNKPSKSIMKLRASSREGLGDSAAVSRRYAEESVLRSQPSVTEVVEKHEEVKRTEEVERKVQRRQHKERSGHRQHRRQHGERSQHRSRSGGRENRQYYQQQQQAIDYGPWSQPMISAVEMEYRARSTSDVRKSPSPSRRVIFKQRPFTAEDLNSAVRSAYESVDRAYEYIRNSTSRHRGNGYAPSYEGYQRQTTTQRQGGRDNYDDFSGGGGGGLAHARYGSVSDSLRKGQLKYVPNGEVRERHRSSGRSGGGGSRFHKSYSNRDVFTSDFDDRSYAGSYRPGGPIVEFPATLPRGDMPPMPPPHRGSRGTNGYHRESYGSSFEGQPLVKSRSYADWDEQGRGGWNNALRRYNDDMTRMEQEFQDSLLMPLPTPGSNVNEKDHRTDKIPGGYESIARETHANAGRRLNAQGMPSDFNEATQEVSYKRETEGPRPH